MRLATLPSRQRANARVTIAVARTGGMTRIAHIAEAGSARVRLPRRHCGLVEAVLINTGGGVAAGDRFATAVAVGAEADLAMTSAAAEKVYRSDGAAATVTTRIEVAAAGRLAWLPQETILFNGARLQRRLDVDIAASASALLFEATVFGRAASGETFAAGSYEDRWRVRREGRLVYADTFRLARDAADRLASPTGVAGRRALASLLYVAPDAEARIEEARAALEGAASECGASAWSGLILARFLAADVETLRRDAARFMTMFRGCPMPRVWQT